MSALEELPIRSYSSIPCFSPRKRRLRKHAPSSNEVQRLPRNTRTSLLRMKLGAQKVADFDYLSEEIRQKPHVPVFERKLHGIPIVEPQPRPLPIEPPPKPIEVPNETVEEVHEPDGLRGRIVRWLWLQATSYAPATVVTDLELVVNDDDAAEVETEEIPVSKTDEKSNWKSSLSTSSMDSFLSFGSTEYNSTMGSDSEDFLWYGEELEDLSWDAYVPFSDTPDRNRPIEKQAAAPVVSSSDHPQESTSSHASISSASDEDFAARVKHGLRKKLTRSVRKRNLSLLKDSEPVDADTNNSTNEHSEADNENTTLSKDFPKKTGILPSSVTRILSPNRSFLDPRPPWRPPSYNAFPFRENIQSDVLPRSSRSREIYLKKTNKEQETTQLNNCAGTKSYRLSGRSRIPVISRICNEITNEHL